MFWSRKVASGNAKWEIRMISPGCSRVVYKVEQTQKLVASVKNAGIVTYTEPYHSLAWRLSTLQCISSEGHSKSSDCSG